MTKRLLFSLSLLCASCCMLQSSPLQPFSPTLSSEGGLSSPWRGAAENQILYGIYTGDSKTLTTYGITAQRFDVAMHVGSPDLVGTTIVGLRIPIVDEAQIKDLTAWMSNDLTVDNKKMGEPDICCDTLQYNGEQWLQMTFSKPETLTEEGVFVGYSFTSTTNSAPIRLTTTSVDSCFFIHSSITYPRRWTNMYSKNVGSLALQIVLKGENIKEDAAGLAPIPDMVGKLGSHTVPTVTILNHGFNGLTSYDYKYEINGTVKSGHVDLATPLPGIYNAATKLSLNLVAQKDYGMYPVTVSITKINGLDNTDPKAVRISNLYIFKDYPVHRAVVEEYTGTWCGYCPRGYVGLLEMNKKYPNDFVGISYHNGDPMTITETYPSVVSGFPVSWLDRISMTDAYAGSGGSHFAIDKVWEAQCKVFSIGDIGLSAQWADDDENMIDVTADVTFEAGREDCPYRLAYVLTADSLTGTTSDWSQHNYYVDVPTLYPDADMDLFNKGTGLMAGLPFSDVAIESSNLLGEANSLQAPVVAGKTQTGHYRFDSRLARNNKGVSLLQDKNKLNAVVLLIDYSTGYILNARKTKVLPSATSVNATSLTQPIDAAMHFEGNALIISNNGTAPLKAVIYDVSGRQLATTTVRDQKAVEVASSGTYLVRLSDGKTAVVRKLTK